MKKKNLSKMIAAAMLAVMLAALPLMNSAVAEETGQATVTQTQTAQAEQNGSEGAQILQMSTGSGQQDGQTGEPPADGSAETPTGRPGEPPANGSGETPIGQPGEPPANGQTGEAPSGGLHFGSGENGENGTELRGKSGHKRGENGEMTGEPGQMPDGMDPRGEQSGAQNADKACLPTWAVAAISGGAGLVIGAGVMFIIMKAAAKKAKTPDGGSAAAEKDQMNGNETDEKAGDAMEEAQVNE